MKLRQALLLVVVFSAMISMSSCVRNYICHCTITYSGQPGLPDSTFKEYNITDKKAKAKSTCTGNSKTFVNNSDTTKENCFLY